MKILSFLRQMVLPLMLLDLLGGATPQPSAVVVQSPSKVVGDYVEARTASVFAGACHYNGELVTTGRDAVMAWKIASGSWRGTDLTGVTAMAAVSCDDNLKNDAAARQSEIVVNASATPAQTGAFADFLAKKCGQQLGKITSIRHGIVWFDHTGSTYTVNSEGFAEMKVQSMPNDECCKQPSLVWYSPLMPLVHRKVGYTLDSGYDAGNVGDPWQRSEENTAFYGAFEGGS
jgi:hypothetical protein